MQKHNQDILYIVKYVMFSSIANNYRDNKIKTTINNNKNFEI